jgi:hypothetical protein
MESLPKLLYAELVQYFLAYNMALTLTPAYKIIRGSRNSFFAYLTTLSQLHVLHNVEQ